MVRFLPIEKTKKKDRQGIFRTFFSKLFYKKKPDFVKLLSEKDLSPEQLVQIRNAMEKGLSENQLIVLINNKMPAEQMAEIIDIAVYENKMKEVMAWD